MSEAKDKLQAAIDKHGLSIKSEFIPFSKSRNAEPGKDGKSWRSLNWRVTLQRVSLVEPGTVRDIITTDYSAGVAHCPAYRADVKTFGHRNSVMRHDAIAFEIEHGRSFGHFASRGFGDMPDTVDVIASLVRDADVLDVGSFEEWAADLGLDPDSRKAEATYRACLEIALKLRAGLGETALAELREAASDY